MTDQEMLDALAQREAELRGYMGEAMQMEHAVARDAVMRKIEEELEQIGQLRSRLLQPPAPPIDEATVRAWIAEFIQLTSRDPRVALDRGDDPRTGYDPQTRTINVGDDFDKRALFRALGRAVEQDVPAIREAGDDVFASGIAYFADAEGMAELARIDPDHFTFVTRVLDALRKQRP